MSPQIIFSAHAPIEMTKPHKVRLRYPVLKAGYEFFGGFKWNDRSNNPEKNSNTRYISEPKLLLLLLSLMRIL